MPASCRRVTAWGLGEVHQEREHADDDDEDRAGASHRGGMIQAAAVPRRRRRSSRRRDVGDARTRARQASRWALIRSASARLIPGTAAICSTGASRTRLAEPNTLQQLAPALRPDARQVVERRAGRALRAQVAVVGDREPVRLVAQPLDEVQGLRRRPAAGRARRRPGRNSSSRSLARPDQRQVVQPELVEHLLGGAHLAPAAVDDHEVGHRPAQLLLVALLARLRAAEAAPQHLLVAREVVRALDGPDPEPPVLAGPRPALLEHHHAADRVACPGSSRCRSTRCASAARRARAPSPAPRARRASGPRRPASGRPRARASRRRCGSRAPSARASRRAAGCGSGRREPRRSVEERLEVGGVGERARHEDLARDAGRPRVVLLEEAAEHLVVGRRRGGRRGRTRPGRASCRCGRRTAGRPPGRPCGRAPTRSSSVRANAAIFWLSIVRSIARILSRTTAACSYCCGSAAKPISCRSPSTSASALPSRNSSTWSMSRR